MTAALAMSDPSHPGNHGNCRITRPGCRSLCAELSLRDLI
jgi:hypothetical protein